MGCHTTQLKDTKCATLKDVFPQNFFCNLTISIIDELVKFIYYQVNILLSFHQPITVHSITKPSPIVLHFDQL